MFTIGTPPSDRPRGRPPTRRRDTTSTDNEHNTNTAPAVSGDTPITLHDAPIPHRESVMPPIRLQSRKRSNTDETRTHIHRSHSTMYTRTNDDDKAEVAPAARWKERNRRRARARQAEHVSAGHEDRVDGHGHGATLLKHKLPRRLQKKRRLQPKGAARRLAIYSPRRPFRRRSRCRSSSHASGSAG